MSDSPLISIPTGRKLEDDGPKRPPRTGTCCPTRSLALVAPWTSFSRVARRRERALSDTFRSRMGSYDDERVFS